MVVGRWTTSPNFPTTPGAFDSTFNAYEYVFASRLSSDGASLLWSAYIGGEFTDMTAVLFKRML